MRHFNTEDGCLFYSFPIEVKEKEKIDGILELLEDSEISELIGVGYSECGLGRPEYNPFKLFTGILLGFAIGNSTLRELESSFRNDLRFIYIMDGGIPDHSTISRFINQVILPNEKEIFAAITKTIFRKCEQKMDVCFIDGTKQEANANKYKFVWKPTKFHEKLDRNTRNLLAEMGLSEGLPNEGWLSSQLILRKMNEASNILPGDVGKTEKAYLAMTKNLIQYYLKTEEYEAKEAICGPDRNSYYKSDHGATAMCLKQDYYSGLGSNMHAAYSIQLIVAAGLIACYNTSQDRTDLYAFEPTVNVFHSMYKKYPKAIGADSGYGCTENYRYCEEHGIVGYLKYQSWEGESSGRRPAMYEYNGDGTITCLGGRIGTKTVIEGRHPRRKGAVFYIVSDCTGCPFMTYCRQFMKELVGTEKIFEVQEDFCRYKQQARDLLCSPEGIAMRVNRSCQVEGVFGVMKQDMSYRRFRRTTLEKVSCETMLNCLGFNIRKYMRFLEGKAKFNYWTPPEDLEAEVFKKPSAKRLANRVNRKREKSANEIARDYKYKKLR